MKRKSPIWMPLYIAEFIADTANLTAVQGWAYIQLLCAMWRSEDGTLPNDVATLARVGKVPQYRWAEVWNSIKSLFNVDGDRVTSTSLQAELGKANAKIVVKRAAASLGGLTTQYRRSCAHQMRTASSPNPLNNNNAPQANAQHNYNYNIENKKERSGSTRPETVEPSLKGAFSGELGISSPPQSPISPESPSEHPLMRSLRNLEAFRKLRGGHR